MGRPPQNLVLYNLLWNEEDIFSLDVNIIRGIEPNFRRDSSIVKYSDSHYQQDTTSTTSAERILSSYIGTVAQPTEDEARILETAQANWNSEIADLSLQSHDLLGKVEQICKKLVEIQHTMKHRRSQAALASALCAPIRRLPIEILCRIFHMCIPTNKILRSKPSVAPLLLCRVCNAWKNIATNDPALWSCIRMNVSSCVLSSSVSRESPLHVCQRLQKFVGHSQNLPLEIIIVQQALYVNDEAVSLLSSCFQRCRALSIVTCSRLHEAIFRELRHNQFPLLENVSFRFSRPLVLAEWMDGEVPINIFPLAPNLRTVWLHTSNPDDLKYIGLPYSRLRRLVCAMAYCDRTINGSFANNAVRQWKGFVRKCTDLEILEVYFHGLGSASRERLIDDALSATQEEFASFANLKKLTIRVGFHAELITILRNFSFPSLDSLEVESVGTIVKLKHQKLQIRDALRDCIPFFVGLTHLRLLRMEMRDNELRSLLRSTQHLVSLDILHGFYEHETFWIDDENLVNWLTVVDESQGEVLLPRLRYLRLYFACAEESIVEDVKRYADLAMSRYQWAVEHPYSRLDLPPPKDISSSPFRLCLKFEGEIWEMRREVMEAMGDLACRALQSEYSRSFTKERIFQDL